jgi:glycosyltransferase involved in cell wall biosynthesis
VLDRITPLILTFNEAPNIGRILGQLAWARDVVVVDSFSTDDTVAIVGKYASARTFQRNFDDHAKQWDYGLNATAIGTDWVLALDADYIVTPEFLDEVRALAPEDDVAGYRVRFKYCIAGRALRGAVYPPGIVLYRRAAASYEQDGHTQRVKLTGRIQDLASFILHDDRKPLQQWLLSQGRYMRLEADKLRKLSFAELATHDRVRRLIVVAPLGMFLYCMFVKGNFLDGRRGLFYALQRSLAESILSLYLLQGLISAGPESD